MLSHSHAVEWPAPADASALGLSAVAPGALFGPVSAVGGKPGGRRHQGPRDVEDQERGSLDVRPGEEALDLQVMASGSRDAQVPGRDATRTGWLRMVGVRATGLDSDHRVHTQLARLARKDLRWRFLSGVPVGIDGTHIDHLVIGPGGVYTLNTRFHPRGRVWVQGNVFRVDGAAYAYISNSRHEALRAGRCLSAACGFQVNVRGVVVLDGADEINLRDPASDVHVLHRSAVRGWLKRREQVLDGPTLAAVFDAARRSTTWTPLV